MKYRYPKKIVVGSVSFKMVYDYDSTGGASFSYPSKNQKAFVKFSLKTHKENPLDFMMMIIHEFKEIIQLEQSVRYTKHGEHSRFEFHYTHTEHEDLCCRLSGILEKFIK